MLDDIMDDSTLRRGVPCWYRKPEVGLEAINDAVLINSSSMEVATTFLNDHPLYSKIMELFNDVSIVCISNVIHQIFLQIVTRYMYISHLN